MVGCEKKSAVYNIRVIIDHDGLDDSGESAKVVDWRLRANHLS